ncbi:hypothetical protein, partial [Thiolapillus sp.]
VAATIDFSVKPAVFVFQYPSQKQSVNILLSERIMTHFLEQFSCWLAMPASQHPLKVWICKSKR